MFGKRKRIVKRIMIVEDEPLLAFENELMLEDEGYEVVATLDTFEGAMEVLDREKVDLILSDIKLNGEKSGIDLAREATQRGIPVLFVTANVPDGAARLAVGSLAKPYNERILKAALESVEQHLGGAMPRPVRGLELYARPE